MIRTKLPAKGTVASHCVERGLGMAGCVCVCGGGSVLSLWEL